MTIRFLNPSETTYVRDAINSDPGVQISRAGFSRKIFF